MKNIFWVINKEKVYAYLVSVVTIVILFFMSMNINNDITTKEASSDLEKNINMQNTETIQEETPSIGESALVSNDNVLIENKKK